MKLRFVFLFLILSIIAVQVWAYNVIVIFEFSNSTPQNIPVLFHGYQSNFCGKEVGFVIPAGSRVRYDVCIEEKNDPAFDFEYGRDIGQTITFNGHLTHGRNMGHEYHFTLGRNSWHGYKVSVYPKELDVDDLSQQIVLVDFESR